MTTTLPDDQGAPTTPPGPPDRSLYTGQQFVIINLDAVEALGSWETAGVWQRICWRAERDGCWRATLDDIASEVRLSIPMVRRVTKRLRDAGWLAATREDKWDATLTWRPLWASDPAGGAQNEHPEMRPPPRGAQNEHLDVPELSTSEVLKLSTSSSKTDKTNYQDNRPRAEVAPAPPRGVAAAAVAADSATTLVDVEPLPPDNPVERLCEHLAARVRGNGGAAKPNATWRRIAEALLAEHTEAEIIAVIDYAHDGDFWPSHCLTMAGVRKHWNKIRVQQQSRRNGRGHRNEHFAAPDDPDHRERLALFGGSGGGQEVWPR